MSLIHSRFIVQFSAAMLCLALMVPAAWAQERSSEIRTFSQPGSRPGSFQMMKSATSTGDAFTLTDDQGTELFRVGPLGRTFLGGSQETTNMLQIQNTADSLGGLGVFQHSVLSRHVGLYTESIGAAPLVSQQLGSNGSGGYSIIWDETQQNPNTAFLAYTNSLGRAALFSVLNPSNDSAAVISYTEGLGPAHVSRISNSNNGAPAHLVLTNGQGSGVSSQVIDPASGATAIEAHTQGAGHALTVTRVDANDTGNEAAAVELMQQGTGIVLGVTQEGNGTALGVNHAGGTGDVASFEVHGDPVVRIEKNGDVYADGTFNGGGADVAEAFAVEGRVEAYEAGDVLVISAERDRTVTRSQEPYSTAVVGVHATKPGVLLSEQGLDTNWSERVPMGVVGVIPTKVTLEGGPIQRGDLLVTSSTPGHAMKADPERLGFGQVLGKALEPFDGANTGVIEVLINVK